MQIARGHVDADAAGAHVPARESCGHGVRRADLAPPNEVGVLEEPVECSQRRGSSRCATAVACSLSDALGFCKPVQLVRLAQRMRSVLL